MYTLISTCHHPIKPKIDQSVNSNPLKNDLSNLPSNYITAMNNENSVVIDLSTYTNIPPEFIDPFTHKLMIDPVRASTGTFFDRNTLISQFNKSSRVIDPNTDLPIMNQNWVVDQNLKARIANWKITHNYK